MQSGISVEDAAKALLDRRRARADFRRWCVLCGYEPAQHHDLIISKCQELVDGKAAKSKVMLLMPPGSAKSTYTSALLPPWYLGRSPGKTILACSYSATLAESFGRRGRNLVSEHSDLLGYELKSDSKSAGEWETSSGGRYFCAGVGAGIAGHRADLGLIDDPLGSEEDADSKLVREKQWAWYWNDFMPRLKPNAIQILICNRRHEEDLAGMLLATESDEWEVINLPFKAGANDVLGRKEGDYLWPEYFSDTIVRLYLKLPPRTRAGLYDQKPAPEEGDYFKRDWLLGYEPQDLPPLSQLRLYAASDHAVSERDDANKSCFGMCGIDSDDNMYILPQLFWERADAEKTVEAMLLMGRKKPIVWRAERGHITKSIGPFLRKRMREEKVYFTIEEVTPVKDKSTRARSIQGRMSMGKVLFPKFTTWWPDAEHELLSFPAGRADDFVDMLAHLGSLVDRMTLPDEVVLDPVLQSPKWTPTFAWVKNSARDKERRELVESN